MSNATAESLLESVRKIAPIIREHAAEAEEGRRLSGSVVDAMIGAGLFNMSRPKALGA